MDTPTAAELAAAGLGLDHDGLRLVETTVTWLAIGARLRDRVAGLLAGHPVEVEVIGSSSVPGLLAKPIIDLAVGIAAAPKPAAPDRVAAAGTNAASGTDAANTASGADAASGTDPANAVSGTDAAAVGTGLLPEDLRALLVADGWSYRGDAGNDGGHVFVLETRPWHRVAHLHLVEGGGEQWGNYLRLRDLLRRSPEARARYQAVKLRLAAQQPTDRKAYTSGKTDVVTELLGNRID